MGCGARADATRAAVEHALIWTLLSSLALAGAPVDAVTQAVHDTASARAARTSAPPSIPLEAYEKAARGERPTGLERVPGHAARKAWGVTVVEAPIDKVWAAINDFPSRTDLSAVSVSEIQSGRHCASGRTIFQYLPIGMPMVSDRWWVIQLSVNRALWGQTSGRMREMTSQSLDGDAVLRTDTAKARAADGTRIAFSKGGWLAIDVDGQHTIVEFHVWSDPGGFVPAGIASSFASGGVRDNLEAIETLARGAVSCPLE